jgi:hypothetical protein
MSAGYQRYSIHTQKTPGVASWPTQYLVHVGKVGLAKHLLSELISTRFNLDILLSRPCIFGVYSGPMGGFAPRPENCVACLRCMNEYYQFVCISPNPAHQKLGDTYFNSRFIDLLTHEAETGTVPVKGAGYRGKFGGTGFDGMWTDVSVVVRPSCDGIHGREFISTSVDIGSKPAYLIFDDNGLPKGKIPETFSIPLPIIFDILPTSVETPHIWQIISQAANSIQTLALVPHEVISKNGIAGSHIVPCVKPAEVEGLINIPFTPRLVELEGWESGAFNRLKEIFPNTQPCLRLQFGANLLDLYRQGVRVFHLTANYHGRCSDGLYILDSIRKSHNILVEAGIRDQITIIGSGGFIAAEHLPKAIICGLDLIALDTPLVVALQGKFVGEAVDLATNKFVMPKKLPESWGVQRLINLCSSWRDQLLQIMGPMGIRDTRRLRGEIGRAMLMKELEAAAFAEIDGYAFEE